MKASEVIRGALEHLGPNGERWSAEGWGDDHHSCVAASLNRVALSLCHFQDARSLLDARRFVREEIGTLIPIWNDDPHTTWEDVHLVLKRALHAAEEAGQ